MAGILLLLSMGILVTAGQWVGVKALRLGEASVIGNFDYTQLIYAALLGFMLFGEVPDSFTIVGAVIIVGSSLYIFRRETTQHRRSANSASSSTKKPQAR